MAVTKITTTIPAHLKEQLVQLQDEMHLSMATIYREAIEHYIESKEIEKWEKGFKLASENEEYQNLCKELGSDDGGLHEY